MTRLRFLTAGESHGPGLSGIIEGIPAGLPLTHDDVDQELRRRQLGYGRGGRMKIEQDHVELRAGVRWGMTIGSPIALFIENKDWNNWQEGMAVDSASAGSIPAVTRPRPGHADLAGALKYATGDIRNILERSSARETAMRVAVGAVAKKFLRLFDITLLSYVTQVGSVRIGQPFVLTDPQEDLRVIDASALRCPDAETTERMKCLIDEARTKDDSLGGVFEVVAAGVPVGLGSHLQWDLRLDGRLCQALASIQAVKGVEVGSGFFMAGQFGSQVMDEIHYVNPSVMRHESRGRGPEALSCGELAGGFYRRTNHAGGIEGGITNGMPLVLRAAMKPIPTQAKPLRSVDLLTTEPVSATYERSDICAVPAAAVVAEAMTALVLADAFLQKFGGDSAAETTRNYQAYMEHVKSREAGH